MRFPSVIAAIIAARQSRTSSSFAFQPTTTPRSLPLPLSFSSSSSSLPTTIRTPSSLYAPIALTKQTTSPATFKKIAPTPPPPTKTVLYQSASAASKDEEGGLTEGSASISNEIFNLVKSIVGAGVLSLPAGIAAFGNAPSAVVPAIALISIIGFFSGYGFSLIGRVCSYTSDTSPESKTTSYRGAWEKTLGESTSFIPAATCTLKTCFAILSYSMILADTIKALLSTAGLEVTRTVALAGITTTTLLPLCLLKNLSSLAPFSLVGIGGMFYTSLAMAIRYLGGGYKLGSAAVKASKGVVAKAAIPAGRFLADVSPNYRPSFGSLGASSAFTSPKIFILICMLSTAYMAHFNAPKFYSELKKDPSKPSKIGIRRFNAVVGTSFAISVLLFGLIGSLGFLTFGENCSGLILNNYSNGDVLMSFSRIAVAISLIFSFPLAFVGARDGWLDLLNIPPEKRTTATLNKFTFFILGGITVLASQLKELAFIMSFAGATLGNALIYVYPALMFRGAVKKMEEKGKEGLKGLKREVPFAMFSALLGLVMGGIGTKMAFGLL